MLTMARPIKTKLELIADNIRAGYARVSKGGQEWIEGSLELAAALKDGRDNVPANIAFNEWLTQNDLNIYGANERSALINLASDLTLARQILAETKSRSYQLIWSENKRRFTSASKTRTKKRRDRVKRNFNRAEIHYRMKLGDETVDKLKGTSLDNSVELRELVMLNRGVPPGQLTEVVRQLVTDASAGKDVSAVAESAKITGRKLEPLMAAWKKRMVFAWTNADYAEQMRFIDYLRSQLKSQGDRS